MVYTFVLSFVDGNTLWPALFVLGFLAFIVSVAMTFVRPESREWRVAAAVNVIPVAMLFAWMAFVAITGFNG
jgi:hypothetical protein